MVELKLMIRLWNGLIRINNRCLCRKPDWPPLTEECLATGTVQRKKVLIMHLQAQLSMQVLIRILWLSSKKKKSSRNSLLNNKQKMLKMPLLKRKEALIYCHLHSKNKHLSHLQH